MYKTLLILLMFIFISCMGMEENEQFIVSNEQFIVSTGKKELPVFIIAGQSNAYRLGIIQAPKVKQGPSMWLYINPNCLRADVLKTGVRRLNMHGAKGFGKGIVTGLAKIYPDGFAIIRYGICGFTLYTQRNPDNKYDGYYYYNEYFKPFVAAAMQKFAAQSQFEPKIKGMLWHQGESNSTSKVGLIAWKKMMPILINDFYKIYGRMPFVMGEIRGYGGKKPLAEKFNEYMHEIADEDSLVSAVKMGETIGWMSPTDVHFSLPGSFIAGQRMVDSWHKLYMDNEKE